MKKLIALSLAVLMLLTLCACGKSAEPQTAAPAPAGTPAAEPAPAEPSAAEPAPEPAAPGYFLAAEYERLYYAPADGSDPRLVVDNSVIRTVRTDDWLYASFDDGSVCRISLDGSTVEELCPAGGHDYRYLIPFDSGFVGIYFSMLDGAGYELYRDGSQTPTPLFTDDPVLSSYAAGRYLYCSRYGGDSGDTLIAYDPVNLEPVWEIPIDAVPDMMYDESGILCFIPNSGKLYRLDEEARTLTPVDIQLTNTDCELIVSRGGTSLVQGNYSDDFNYYLVNSESRRRITDSLPEYFSVADVLGSRVLLHYYKSGESAAGEDNWYSTDNFKILDLESGEVSDFTVRGQYGRLFADGDFPVMDSSTARKPVTSEIYAFFCESTGAGGAVPLCSTTHNAWLNIADRVADVALLAAPTQEEQDYLDERGVTVEMKLYGGDGLVFIGNRECGVENLSLDQVRAIYRGDITNWAQLGGVDHAIRVLYRDDQSGSQRLFERMVWKDEPVPDFEALGYARLDDMSTIVSECLYDPYSIGYSIMTYLNDVFSREELLSFSLDGYAATPENVAAKNYPLGTQGFVVIRSDEPADSPARRLFDWFGSPLSDLILTRNGVTPLHDS